MKRFLQSQILLSSLAVQLLALPAQIVIVPSAEQSFGILTLKGQERAEALAPCLSQTPAYIGPGVYQSIFATRPSVVNSSLASIQTMSSIGFSLALPVHSPYGAGQEEDLASLLLENKRYDGTNIVIAWQIGYLSDLIEALGYDSSGIPSDRSDVVFVLAYPITSLTPGVFAQQLLYGDSSAY